MIHLRKGRTTAPAIITLGRGCGDCASLAEPQDTFCRRCGARIDHKAKQLVEPDGPFVAFGPPAGFRQA
jgi:predicted amidophosphoribosyltransferase